ncbi:hypothetical protein C8R47DRAFT_1071582 [Mycena vitilis]|nr:hypothetical protein C8R47DRAFT_1071582 [Mycena vitilis]
MSTILASLAPGDVSPALEQVVEGGRFLLNYVGTDNVPLHVLIVGRLLHVSVLDDGLDLLTLVAPAPEFPITRQMFMDQHAPLRDLMAAGEADFSRPVVSTQVWCQGQPASPHMHVYVRDVSDLAAAPGNFDSFQSEVPFVSGSVRVYVPGAMLACSADMFRVDMPVLDEAGITQEVFTRAYGLNASSVVRFVRRSVE